MKGVYNRGYRDSAEESFFEEGYGVGAGGGGILGGELWIRCEEYDKLEQSEITFQGRLFQKSSKTKKWQSYHFELYSDRFIRISQNTGVNISNINGNQNVINSSTLLQQQGMNGENGEIQNTIESVELCGCYLKKIKYSDTSYANYKYGIRLQKGEQKSELFTESGENFNKLYEEIKRFCILPKFAKKYKVLTKFKSGNVNGQTSAHLYKCFRYSDSTQYCVRIIDKYTLTDQGRQAILKETAILRKIDHPSLIKLYEVYEDETNIFLIYELLQGKDLKSKVNELLCMDEKNVSDFIWKLLHGLQHMHARNIVHRDIRLENIYFRAANNLQDVCISNFFLADFIDASRCIGTSASYLPSKQNYRKYSAIGYVAPEVLKNKHYDAKVDIFSLGVIFYLLVFGRMPFEGKDAEETLRLNEKGDVDYSIQPFFGKFTSSAFDLMKKMLHRDQKLRGDAASLLNHTWFVNMRNRSEEGKPRSNNYYGFPTLSTVEEHSEGNDLVSISQEKDSRILHNYDLKDLKYLSDSAAEEFINIRNDDDVPRSTYTHNVIKDGSFIYEDEFNKETLSDKMITLNKIQFIKVPSKFRHDSFHYHLSSRLGINLQQFYNINPSASTNITEQIVANTQQNQQIAQSSQSSIIPQQQIPSLTQTSLLDSSHQQMTAYSITTLQQQQQVPVNQQMNSSSSSLNNFNESRLPINKSQNTSFS